VEGHELAVPTREDGTPKSFWYDQEGEHIIWRRPGGEMTAIGWECRHEVEQVYD
jgi:hypothetical protein